MMMYDVSLCDGPKEITYMKAMIRFTEQLAVFKIQTCQTYV